MTGSKKQCINWLLESEADIFDVKIHKEKRNKKQNDKYWHLLNELAKKVKKGWREIHFDMLKNYSVTYEMMVPEETEIRGIEYYEKKSTIIKNGKKFNVYHVYTPSHELKTDEFAILLDGLIHEAIQQGIDVRSPDKILMEEQIYERNMERHTKL